VVPKPTYSHALLEYSKELKSCYKSLLPNQQINLLEMKLFLKHDSINSVKKRKLIYSSSVHSRLEKEVVQREPIDFDVIFTSKCKCILMESLSAFCNTEFVRYLVSQWGESAQLSNFNFLVVLDLKKKHVQRINSLWDMFYHNNPGIQQELVVEIKSTKGKNVLIIIEGFEHLPDTVTQNLHSIYAKLIEGKILCKSTKFITGTPASIKSIIGNYDITGFKHVELLNLISKYSPINGSGRSGKKFDQQLREMSVPSTGECTGYVVSMLHEYFSDTTSLSTLSELKQNHQVHNSLLILSRLAFMGMVEADLVFNDHLANDSGSHFGMLASSCIHCNNEMAEFEFLTQTLQEFLAGYFISHLNDREQNEIFSSNSFVQFASMWKYVAGLCGLTFTMLHTFKSQIHDFPSLVAIVNILYELHDDKTAKYIFEDSPIVSFSHCKSHVTDIGVLHFFKLGYCVASSSTQWKLNFSWSNLECEHMEAFASGMKSCPTHSGYICSLQLDFNSMTHDKVLLLSKFSLHNLRSLSMASCAMTPKSFDSLVSILDLMPRLNTLNVSGNGSPCPNLATKLLNFLPVCSSIKSLHLEGTSLGYEDIVILNTALSMPTSILFELSVGSKSMTAECAHLLIDTILSQSSVKVLRIFDLDLTGDINPLGLIESNTVLTSVVFFECLLDLSFLATSLCMNIALKELEIFFALNSSNCDIGEEAAITLADLIEVNCSLSTVSIYSYKNLPQGRVLKIFEPLTYNQTLNVFRVPIHFAERLTSAQLEAVDSRVNWNEWPCIL